MRDDSTSLMIASYGETRVTALHFFNLTLCGTSFKVSGDNKLMFTYGNEEKSVFLDDTIATTQTDNHNKPACANHQTNNDKKPGASQQHAVLILKH